MAKQTISLDKAWHGIHFLLTGTAWEVKGPAGQAILGGREFGEDMGYGPARVLSVAQVKAIAEALAKITPENLSVRYSPDAMTKAEIYPTIIWNREGPEALVFLLNYYKPLVTFYRRAAEKGQLVVIAIT
ncbi:YfbM family protein [Rhodanobacter sp. B04]|uniref:YfbM family protein n=1 Tax=Rhodanobacter sp. B04 TaxID=1945860 RepID=UPI0014397B26|nr:YfbM family protein [Rhodanobacter sp. B04]